METLTEQQRTQLETVHGRNNKLIWAIFKGTPGNSVIKYLLTIIESVEYFINQGADIEHRDKGKIQKNANYKQFNYRWQNSYLSCRKGR